MYIFECVRMCSVRFFCERIRPLTVSSRIYILACSHHMCNVHGMHLDGAHQRYISTSVIKMRKWRRTFNCRSRTASACGSSAMHHVIGYIYIYICTYISHSHKCDKWRIAFIAHSKHIPRVYIYVYT